MLRELSHEFDYLSSLFGEIIYASGMIFNRKYNDLDVEDTAMLHMKFGDKENPIPISLNLDFTRQDPTRYCDIVGELGTVRWDLIVGTIVMRRSNSFCKVIGDFEKDLSFSYRNMWNEILAERFQKFTDIDTATSYLKCIEALEEKGVYTNE